MNKLPLITLPLLAVALLTGCGTAGGLFTAQPVVTYEPKPVIVTNAVVEIVTNPATGEQLTNIAYVPATIWQTNVTTNTLYAVAPGVSGAISTGQQIAPLLPAPYGTAIELALAAAAAGLGFLVRAKNKKLESVQEVADLVQPIIAGIESAGDAAQPVKTNVQRFATAAGVEDRLRPLVKSVSAQLPK
jgi:hypothetical protein